MTPSRPLFSSVLHQHLSGVSGVITTLALTLLFLSAGQAQDIARTGLAVAVLLTMPMIYSRTLRQFLLIPAVTALILGSLLWFEHLSV